MVILEQQLLVVLVYSILQYYIILYYIIQYFTFYTFEKYVILKKKKIVVTFHIYFEIFQETKKDKKLNKFDFF